MHILKPQIAGPSQSIPSKSTSIYSISLNFGGSSVEKFELEKGRYKKIAKLISILQNKIRKYYYQLTMAVEFSHKEQKTNKIAKICEIIGRVTDRVNFKRLNEYLSTTQLTN